MWSLLWLLLTQSPLWRLFWNWRLAANQTLRTHNSRITVKMIWRYKDVTIREQSGALRYNAFTLGIWLWTLIRNLSIHKKRQLFTSHELNAATQIEPAGFERQLNTGPRFICPFSLFAMLPQAPRFEWMRCECMSVCVCVSQEMKRLWKTQ